MNIWYGKNLKRDLLDIENLIRENLQVKLNSNKLEKPFSRVIFYELGSRSISAILKENPEIKGNIKCIYDKINI